MIGAPGIIIPESVMAHGSPVRYWGARAIFEEDGTFDILSDRQTCGMRPGDTVLITAANDPKVNQIYHWIDTVGLPWLRKEAVRLARNSEETVTYTSGRFSIVASPNKSHGYLYIWACEHHKAVAQYELSEPDTSAKWSGGTIPTIGDRVNVTMNGFGPGKVIGYYVEHGYLGVHVKVDTQPEWHVKQGGRKYVMVCGNEIKTL